MNMKLDFYWAIVIAVISGCWAFLAFIRDRKSNSIKQSKATITRLIEYSKLQIENPDIQKYLSQNASMNEMYFRDLKRLEEDIFFKAKTIVYIQLNLFDEILSASSQASTKWSFLKPVSLYELTDWEDYIKETLRHPLYRSILNNENHIFGAVLRDFWNINKREIEIKSADPFIW